MNNNLKISIEAALVAGREIMDIYRQEDLQVVEKSDSSPLTLADKRANEVINRFLEPLEIPIISEENRQIPYQVRKNWQQCWIVDPLDGTKEFIKRNGEFTVNIALVFKGVPLLGVIFAPAINTLYFADVKEERAYKVIVEGNETIADFIAKAVELHPAHDYSTIKIVGSRSHMNQATLEFLEALKERSDREVEVVSVGSSLKFCLVAEGAAHYYPRFAPTMEWDTAAGQAICEAVGIKVRERKSGEIMRYNREVLLNEHFLVSNEANIL